MFMFQVMKSYYKSRSLSNKDGCKLSAHLPLNRWNLILLPLNLIWP